MIPFTIDERIEYAETLPAEFYTDPHWFELIKDKILARSWHCIGHSSDFRQRAQPLTLLPGVLSEPLLLTVDEQGHRRLLSNVCTHRGMLVETENSDSPGLRCGYHGRCFDLSGCFRSMPEFEEARDFPRPADDLPALTLFDWHGLLLTSLDPVMSADELFAYVDREFDFLPMASAKIDHGCDVDYEVKANWMVYCDNYLEGFHIPFVHPGLAAVLDYQQYRTELFDWGSVQIGVASAGDSCFDFPAQHKYSGQDIAGFYIHLFPGTLLNIYPWGISINLIIPKAIDRTLVRYRSWVWDEAKRKQGAGNNLAAVEMEDEAVVEMVQRGLQSRIYKRGRYSPKRERGVHHFHRILADLIY